MEGVLAEHLIQLANSPVGGAVASKLAEKGWEAAADLWEEAEDEVPDGNLVIPDPRYAGPLLTSAQYYSEPDRLREMFKELLKRGMDKSRQDQAHPGFTEIVRQLSSDEAKILDRITWHDLEKLAENFARTPFHLKRHYTRNNQEGWRLDEVEFDGDIELAFPENKRMYVEHLDGLGLVQDRFAHNEEPDEREKLYASFKNMTISARNSILDTGLDESEEPTITSYTGEVGLTEYGKEFMKACSPE